MNASNKPESSDFIDEEPFVDGPVLPLPSREDRENEKLYRKSEKYRYDRGISLGPASQPRNRALARPGGSQPGRGE
jgi:hypothetical protein